MPRTMPWFVAALIVGLVACGGDPTESDNGGTTTVTLTSASTFSPADLTVDPGTTVRFVNGASLAHTITPGNTAQQGVWSRITTSVSGTVLSHTFTVSGQNYSYFCELHAGMTGIIRVR